MSLDVLGGSIRAGRPAAVTSGPRVSAFAVDATGTVMQWTSVDGGPWIGPIPMPGGGQFSSPMPTAAVLADGSVHVCAIANTGALARWSSVDGGKTWPIPQFIATFPVWVPNGGPALVSLDGHRLDAFAAGSSGIIDYSWNSGVTPSIVPDSLGFTTSALAAVSARTGTLDLFAIEPTVAQPVRWHFDGHHWQRSMLAGPALYTGVGAGLTAIVSPAQTIELFAIARSGTIVQWSLDGSRTTARERSAPTPLPGGLPAVALARDRALELFAIGAGSAFAGGPLVHWRLVDGADDARLHEGNLAAGGLAATTSATGIEVFGMNAGTANPLLHWPGGIHSTATLPWSNWTGNRVAPHPPGHGAPRGRAELIELVRTAARDNVELRAVGSSWSMSDVATTAGYIIETHGLDQVLTDVVPAALTAPYPGRPDAAHLIHVEAGMVLETLMELLDARGLAPFTMGGASGQTVAGVMSTSVHGAHFALPPFPDWIRAVHLIGPDGRQYWIEPADRPISDPVRLAAVLGPDVTLRYDDDWFDAALVGVGSLGIIYAVVVEARPQHMLEDVCLKLPWSTPQLTGAPPAIDVRAMLRDGTVFSTPATIGIGAGALPVSMQVVVDLPSLQSGVKCFVTTRVEVPLVRTVTDSAGVTTEVTTPPIAGGGHEPLAMLCEADGMLMAILTLGTPVAMAMLVPAIAAISPAAALTLSVGLNPVTLIAAVQYLRTTPGAIGDVVGTVLDAHPDLTSLVVGAVSSGALPVSETHPVRRDLAHRVLAPVNRAACAGRGYSLEIAFDTASGAHLAFIDAALAMLADEASRGHMLGGWLSFRFVGRSRALLSPQQRCDRTCMVEATALRSLSSSRALLAKLEALGRQFGGVQHWGMFDDLTALDVAIGYPRLDTWLAVRNQLTRGGAIKTFDSDFARRVDLVPSVRPAQALERASDGARLVVIGGAAFALPDVATLSRDLARRYGDLPTRVVTDAELQHLAPAPGDGTLLRDETGVVFAIFGGAKFAVPDAATLAARFPGAVVREVWPEVLAAIPDCPRDGTFISDGGVAWLVAGGAKFALPDPPHPSGDPHLRLPAFNPGSPAIVNQWFGRHPSYRGPLRRLWDGALAAVPLVPRDGTLWREVASDVVYRCVGGRKVPELRRGPRRGVPSPVDGVTVVWDGALAQIPS